MKKIILACVSLLVFNACALSWQTVPAGNAPAPITPTPTYQGCYYVWASKSLPELTEKFRTELKKAIPNADGSAYAYGEDCIFADGHADFGAMETDFGVKVPVKDLNDTKTLGQVIETLLPVLKQIQGENLPAHIGKIDLEFKSGNDSRYVSFYYEKATRAYEEGLRGAELIEAIDGKY